MNTTQAASAAQELPFPSRDFPALRRSYRLAARRSAPLGVAAVAGDGSAWGESPEVRHVVDERLPFAALERATATWRHLRARELRARAASARATVAQLRDVYARLLSLGGGGGLVGPVPAVALDTAALTQETYAAQARATWYERRAGAQMPRFATIRACGSRTLAISCRTCAESLCAPVPCTCGVVRVCDACAEAVAHGRQRRISDARIEAMAAAGDAGLFHDRRLGGAFSEKMLTLTVPHFELGAASGLVAEQSSAFGLRTTVAARIAALRLAWPRFIRRVKAWLAGRGRRDERRHGDPADAAHLAYYRLFEWTRGSDGLGHPHVHVYVLSPFLPIALLRRWWAASLEAVGVPMPRSCALCRAGEACPFALDASHVNVDIRALDGFSWGALKELIKSGDRRAIELRMGTLQTEGDAAIRYAAGWSMRDAFSAELLDAATVEVQRDLYIALEGRRLAQGSRGFLLAVRRSSCACCGGEAFGALVVYEFEVCETTASSPREERGPPDGEREERDEDDRGVAWLRAAG